LIVRTATWLLLVLASLVPRSAAGADLTRAPVNRYVVAIEVDAPSPVVARVRSTSIEVLERLGVTPVVTQEGAPPSRGELDPLAYAYIDLENPHLPRLVVVDGATRRELMRRTLAETSSLETAIEEATLVLYMVIESLLSSNTASAETPAPARVSTPAGDPSATLAPTPPRAATAKRTPAAKHVTKPDPVIEAPAEAEAEPTSGEPSPAPERGSGRDSTSVAGRVTFDAGAFLRVATLDDSQALTGAGVLVEVRARGAGPRFGAMILGAEHLPVDLSYREASIRLRPFAARLLPTLSFPLGRVFSGVVGVGGGLDWFRTELGSLPIEAEGAGNPSAVDATASALAGVRAHVLRHLLVNLDAGVDLDTSPRTFVVRVGGERRALLELARVRPSLMLGVAFSSHGAPGAGVMP
jgi:hypothetical protein